MAKTTAQGMHPDAQAVNELASTYPLDQNKTWVKVNTKEQDLNKSFTVFEEVDHSK